MQWAGPFSANSEQAVIGEFPLNSAGSRGSGEFHLNESGDTRSHCFCVRIGFRVWNAYGVEVSLFDRKLTFLVPFPLCS